MARSKNNKGTVAPRVAVDVGSTGTRPASKTAVALLITSILAAVFAVAMMTTPGKVGYVYFFFYLDFYIGVVSLVSLSVTIMVGLVATDRLVLSIRQRVLLQSAHRTTGVIAVAALVAHVWTKLAMDYIGVLDVFVPFMVTGTPLRWLYVGLGTVSGWVMVLVMWSGIARAKFIGRGKPWMWRSIHAISYLMWPLALTHGLSAGRPAPTWVTVSYIVCVLGVLVGLAVRLSVSLNRRKDFASPAGVGAVKPNETGTLVPTTVAPIRRPSRPAGDLLAPAGGPQIQQTQAWTPAARPVSPAPQSAARPVSPAARPVSAAPAPVEDDYAPRGRRPVEPEAPAPRQRRPAEDDDRYDTQTRMSRRDLDEERYRYDDEPAPRSRGGRSEMYDDAPTGRGRRFADDEPAPRRRYPDDEPAPRRREDPEITGARLRHDDLETTGARMRLDDPEATGTRMRRDDLEVTGARLRRDDLETTGARMRRDDPEVTGTRMRRYEDDEPRGRGRRRAEEEYDEVPRSRSARYDDAPAPRAARSARYEEPRYEEPRYEEEPPRRPSRSEFVDLADDSPTLVDSGSRRSRRPESRRGRDDSEDGYFSQLRGDVRETN